ncbi:MAG: ATP-binding cassette domain-containing protein [Clostridia bacterium]
MKEKNRIELIDIGKSIKGKEILKDINMQMESGKIYGILGKNASGKSMLFKIIEGIVIPTKGKVLVNGVDIIKEKIFLQGASVLNEKLDLYEDETCLDNLKILNNTLEDKEVESYIDKLNLAKNMKDNVNKLSLGMKQKLGIVSALMGNPDFILLDEPFNGLDKCAVDIVRDMLIKEKNKGKLIIIASHVKEDIDLLCDYVFNI